MSIVHFLHLLILCYCCITDSSFVLRMSALDDFSWFWKDHTKPQHIKIIWSRGIPKYCFTKMLHGRQTIALTDDLIHSVLKKKKKHWGIKYLWCTWKQSHHVFASAISFECGVECCVALSRDACRQMRVISKLWEGGGNVSCWTVEQGKLQEENRETGCYWILAFQRFLCWHLMAVVM